MARYYCMPLYATIPHSHFYIMLFVLSPHTILYVQDHLICVLSTSSMTVWLCSLTALPCLTSPALDLPPPSSAAWTEDNYYHVSACSYTQPPFFKVGGGGGGGGWALKLPPPPPPNFFTCLIKMCIAPLTYMFSQDAGFHHQLPMSWYKSKYLVSNYTALIIWWQSSLKTF